MVTSVAEAVRKKTDKNDGVYKPPQLFNGKRLYVAPDKEISIQNLSQVIFPEPT